MPNYEVKNVRTFRGHEGHGFNATLYRDGVKVADVIDEGNGGCLFFEWHSGHRNATPSEHAATRRCEETILHAYAASLPPVTDTGLPNIDGRPFAYQPDADSVVENLVHEYLVARDLRNLLARKVVLRVGDSIRTTVGKTKPTPELIAAVARANTGAIILNSLPFDAALAHYRSAAP